MKLEPLVECDFGDRYQVKVLITMAPYKASYLN